MEMPADSSSEVSSDACCCLLLRPWVIRYKPSAGRIGYAGLSDRGPLASQGEQNDLPERRLGNIESTCHLGSAGDHRILSATASESM